MVAAVDIRMRRAADDRKLLAKLLDELEIFRRLIAPAGLGRQKVRREETQAQIDGHKPALDVRLRAVSPPRQSGKGRQRQAYARRAKKAPAAESFEVAFHRRSLC